jgi:hypothetical protein
MREPSAGSSPWSSTLLERAPARLTRRVEVDRSPFVHAATKAMRRQLWEAYAWFVATYRDAAEKLRAGDPVPPFPPGCFPPALPFVAA